MDESFIDTIIGQAQELQLDVAYNERGGSIYPLSKIRTCDDINELLKIRKSVNEAHQERKRSQKVESSYRS